MPGLVAYTDLSRAPLRSGLVADQPEHCSFVYGGLPVDYRYPITGCGRPACRTCHPYLIPDEPRGLTPRQVVGAIVGGIVAAVGCYYLVLLLFALGAPIAS
jgi:hypothetical protein